MSETSDRMCWFNRYASLISRLILLRLAAVLWCFFGTEINTWWDDLFFFESTRYSTLNGNKKKEEPFSKSSLISFLLLNRAVFLKVNLIIGFSVNFLVSSTRGPQGITGKFRLLLVPSFVRHWKFFPSFCSSVSDYRTSSHAFHSGTKSMLIPSLSVRWLKCSLHCFNTDLNRPAKIDRLYKITKTCSSNIFWI